LQLRVGPAADQHGGAAQAIAAAQIRDIVVEPEPPP